MKRIAILFVITTLILTVALSSCNATGATSDEVKSAEQVADAFNEVKDTEQVADASTKVTTTEQVAASNVPAWAVTSQGCNNNYSSVLYEYTSGTEYTLPSSKEYHFLAGNNKKALRETLHLLLTISYLS